MMFDGKRFLRENFQSPQRVRAALLAYGLPAPSLAAAEKWFTRGRVSVEFFPLLLCVREMETGATVKLSTYLGRSENDYGRA